MWRLRGECSVCCVYCFFFFQAEDGIRDLVRSRGLGDVYKRQVSNESSEIIRMFNSAFNHLTGNEEDDWPLELRDAVSYTHLTLPTIYSV